MNFQYFVASIVDVTNQKYDMLNQHVSNTQCLIDMLAQWKQKRSINMFETHMFEWHVRMTKLTCLLTCSTRNVCWHDRMSRTRYLSICSNDKNIICRIDKFAEQITKWRSSIRSFVCLIEIKSCAIANIAMHSNKFYEKFRFILLYCNTTRLIISWLQ